MGKCKKSGTGETSPPCVLKDFFLKQRLSWALCWVSTQESNMGTKNWLQAGKWQSEYSLSTGRGEETGGFPPWLHKGRVLRWQTSNEEEPEILTCIFFNTRTI